MFKKNFKKICELCELCELFLCVLHLCVNKIKHNVVFVSFNWYLVDFNVQKVSKVNNSTRM